MSCRIVGVVFAVMCISTMVAPRRFAVGQNWDPPAISVHPDHNRTAAEPGLIPELIENGHALFVAKFNEADGAGRPGATGDSKPTPREPGNSPTLLRTSGPDAMSCAGCHNQPDVGGSGDFVTNAFVGAHFRDPVTYRVDAAVTNERNTTTVHGTGLIELLAREMTKELHQQRQHALERAKRDGQAVSVDLKAKGVPFGAITARPNGTLAMERVEGVDPDLVVRPFGVKGIASSLREFTIAALNQHHGIQAVERFGWDRTGRYDFDEDGVESEFSIGQLTALVVFQAQLAPPPRAAVAETTMDAVGRRGQSLFDQIGCTVCHIPALPLESFEFREPNEYNRPGALQPEPPIATVNVDLSRECDTDGMVWAYTDLKRHNLCDDEISHFGNERFKQDNVDTTLFLTAKLWDLATSAPYGHRGDLTTISSAILAHGGEARSQREAFLRLTDEEKRAIITFLSRLGRS